MWVPALPETPGGRPCSRTRPAIEVGRAGFKHHGRGPVRQGLAVVYRGRFTAPGPWGDKVRAALAGGGASGCSARPDPGRGPRGSIVGPGFEAGGRADVFVTAAPARKSLPAPDSWDLVRVRPRATRSTLSGLRPGPRPGSGQVSRAGLARPGPAGRGCCCSSTPGPLVCRHFPRRYSTPVLARCDWWSLQPARGHPAPPAATDPGPRRARRLVPAGPLRPMVHRPGAGFGRLAWLAHAGTPGRGAGHGPSAEPHRGQPAVGPRVDHHPGAWLTPTRGCFLGWPGRRADRGGRPVRRAKTRAARR